MRLFWCEGWRTPWTRGFLPFGSRPLSGQADRTWTYPSSAGSSPMRTRPPGGCSWTVCPADATSRSHAGPRVQEAALHTPTPAMRLVQIRVAGADQGCRCGTPAQSASRVEQGQRLSRSALPRARDRRGHLDGRFDMTVASGCEGLPWGGVTGRAQSERPKRDPRCQTRHRK